VVPAGDASLRQGHEVLARKLDKHHIQYRKSDNAFTWIEDPQRAQRLADSLVKMNWPGILNALARHWPN